MSLKEKLEIILITYNRAEFVKRTFSQFFYNGSPVTDIDFIVQDNNSNDNTEDVVKEFAKTHPNIKYVKNHYNLGLSGTIARAMERASKDYVWIIGDDDKFDFSNWNEVEDAINNNEKMICHAKYAIPSGQDDNPAYQLLQLAFITGGIYATSLFDDTTIRNAYDNIYTLFPHIPPIIKLINDGGKIYVTQKPISDNGMSKDTDCSFTRGIKNCDELYDRTREMTWVLGYANIVTLLKDKNLQKECMKVSIPNIYGSWDNFYDGITNQYIKTGKLNYFMEIYKVLPKEQQTRFSVDYIKTNLMMFMLF